MDRSEALRVATETVHELIERAPRGVPFSGGVAFEARVDAVERFARFLMESPEGKPETVQDAPGTRYRDKDGDIWTVQPDGELTCSALTGRRTREDAERAYGPLTRIP